MDSDNYDSQSGDDAEKYSVPSAWPPTDRDSFEVSFDGIDDPFCPHSMSLFRKWTIVTILCNVTICVTCTSSAYTSTYTQMNAEFGTSSLVSTLGLSTFLLGIAFGPPMISPLSECYGRRPIYLGTWSLFILSTIPSAVAKNIQTILVTRFFSGAFGGTFLSVSGGTVGDIFLPHQIQHPMSLVSLVPFMGPCVGPIVGGFINYNINWRWTYYIMIIWSSILMAIIVFFTPETFHPIRLYMKAKHLRQQTGDDRYRAPMEKKSGDVQPSKASIIAASMLRPLQFNFLEPMCLCLNVYSAILLAILYLFFLAFPRLFRTEYGMNLWQGGLTFLGIIVGMCLAAASSPVWSNIRTRLVEKHGTSEPEFRLPPAMLGGFLIPIGLFWFGWTISPNIHWIVPIIGSGVFGCGTVLAFTGIYTFLIDAYAKYSASALASNGLTRCLFSAAFPLFGVQMYDRLGHQWATSLLAFLTVAMMPFPWLFFKYGNALRGKSKFALHDKM
ncbi:hypothetical protein CMEL01_09390 [Colletotrichum melonis]|uniref:Major facilitator superfamily (MFS) profile domain-containing protein n=1 Tax=Colletotrichum melonis TaxID=1209925 RepID=A0AAI9TX98_9PEZI|nr:hypothetical protein CMEL01_09390 [Colletotrichum melonis]